MEQEFIHYFKGYGRVPSSCIVRTQVKDGKTLFWFIDIDDGTSVTNASEQLATEMVNKFSLQPEDCRFFESYECYDHDSFDEIKYAWEEVGDKWSAELPKWIPCEDIKDTF